MIKNIRNLFIESILDSQGNLNNVNFKTVFDEYIKKNLNFSRPFFNSIGDKKDGLTIALNDTQGYRVILKNYEFNPETKTYDATLAFRIFDHFGLDIEDVENYGTGKKVLEKTGTIGSVSDGITTTKFTPFPFLSFRDILP